MKVWQQVETNQEKHPSCLDENETEGQPYASREDVLSVGHQVPMLSSAYEIAYGNAKSRFMVIKQSEALMCVNLTTRQHRTTEKGLCHGWIVTSYG